MRALLPLGAAMLGVMQRREPHFDTAIHGLHLKQGGWQPAFGFNRRDSLRSSRPTR